MTTPQESPTSQDAYGRPSGSEPTQQERTVEGMADTVKHEGEAQVHHYRDVAAEKVDKLAQSMDAAAEELRDDEQTAYLSRHVADMADGLNRLSGGLREKSADQILGDLTRVARDNPALFLAGSVALGFGLARFARASAPDTARRTGGGRDYRHTAEQTGSGWADRERASAGGGAATPNIPGTVGHPARGNDTVDTTTPHGVRGTSRAVPGPAAGPGVTTGTTLAGQGEASASGVAGTYTTGAAGSSASGSTGAGTDAPLTGQRDLTGDTDTPRGRT